MNGYWPWWLGALALGAITVGYIWWTGRGLGVSGAWEKTLQWRARRRVERLDDAARASDDAFAELIMRSLAEDAPGLVGAGAAAAGATSGTAAGTTAFGMAGPPGVGARASAAGLPVYSGPNGAPAVSVARHAPVAPSAAPPDRPLPVLCYAVLLAAIFVGGMIGAVTSGTFQLRWDMGPGFADIVTANPALMIPCLFLGGLLVGFGTRMAGGCSSGHGLTGCSRLQPVSLVATATFFGTAVAVSFLLWKVL